MRYLKSISGITLAMMLLIACGDDDVILTPQELRTQDMRGTWIIEAITIDGLDAKANYPDFKIDFQQNSLYSSVNGGRVFRPTGTWSWAGTETVTQLQLDVFTDITINSFSTTELNSFPRTEMTWTFTYALGGVRAGTNGNYAVTFLKL